MGPSYGKTHPIGIPLLAGGQAQDIAGFLHQQRLIAMHHIEWAQAFGRVRSQ
jgi:hypothetical protein